MSCFPQTLAMLAMKVANSAQALGILSNCYYKDENNEEELKRLEKCRILGYRIFL